MKTNRGILNDILAKTDAYKAVLKGCKTIGVEGHASIPWMIGSCTEIGRAQITTPRIAELVTACVTGNKESRVERGITDQKLVGVSVAGSYTVPQSIGTGRLPKVISGRYGLVVLSLEVGFVSSLINEDYFCELKKEKGIISI